MTESKRKTVQEMKEEILARVEELAEQTPEWAKAQGCHRIEKDTEPEVYFIVTPRTKKNDHKPNWLEWSGETPEVWTMVCDRMLSQGVSVCYKTMQGHYIGLPGEQSVKIASSFNNVFTRTTTALRQLEYLLALNMLDDAREFMAARLGSAFDGTDPMQIALSLENFLSDVSPHQKSLFMLMLSSGKESKTE